MNVKQRLALKRRKPKPKRECRGDRLWRRHMDRFRRALWNDVATAFGTRMTEIVMGPKP